MRFKIAIDNEYSQFPSTHAKYFEELEAVYHDSDILVPLTANDPAWRQNWLNGTVCQYILSDERAYLTPFQGAVDVYG